MAYFNGEKMENVVLRDVAGADIRFKNFAGKKDTYNQNGARMFSILLDEETAKDMEDKGWRIKVLENKKDPSMPAIPSVKVRVSFGVVPPKIYMVTSKKKQLLNEETVMLLDTAEIVKCDIVLTPYKGKMSTDDMASAYVRTAYFTIVEDDPFEDEYAEIGADEESGAPLF